MVYGGNLFLFSKQIAMALHSGESHNTMWLLFYKNVYFVAITSSTPFHTLVYTVFLVDPDPDEEEDVEYRIDSEHFLVGTTVSCVFKFQKPDDKTFLWIATEDWLFRSHWQL